MNGPSVRQQRRRFFAGTAAALGLAIFAGGCSDRAADLQIRLSSVQDELDRTKADLDAANHQTDSAPPSGTALPSVAQIEENYDHGIKEMRHDLEHQLTDGSVSNVISYQPRIEEKPYHAEFTLEATMGTRPVRIEHIPVRAGPDGKWTFPGTDELIGRLKEIPQAPAGRAESRPETPAPAPARAATAIAAPGPANETVTVRWGEAGHPRPTAPARRESTSDRSSPPSSPATPAAPAEPAKVMPTSRDVRVHF